MPKKPPQHPRKRACAECDRFMAALRKERREHIKAIGLQIADRDALSEQVEKAEADLTAALANCEEQRRLAEKAETELAPIREENIRIVAESQKTYDWNSKLVTEHYDLGDRIRALTSERDNYRILRDAASEASLRLRMSNLKLEADCAAIRAGRDDVLLKQLAAVDISYFAQLEKCPHCLMRLKDLPPWANLVPHFYGDCVKLTGNLAKGAVTGLTQAEADKMAPEQSATSQDGACEPKGFWSWVMRQKPFGRGR